MSTRDFTANVISATPVVPDGNFKDSKASGVWDINEALDLIKGGNWPNAANINPAAFVDGLFSTDVATGTGSGALTISNGINLSGSGGIVWNKSRSSTNNHFIFDPTLGSGAYLQPNTTAVLATGANYSFTSTGFQDTYNNISSTDQVWWTFRKQPKFFDAISYTGTSADKTINHNLGTAPGFIIIKSLTESRTWFCTHRGLNGGTNWWQYDIHLDSNAQAGTESFYAFLSEPSSTSFTLRGGKSEVNADSQDYVAYVFAHNNNDGGFGEPGDQDIIKCGNYSTNSSAKASIDLGFEPQWIIYRPYDDTADFKIIDNIRDFRPYTPVSGNYNKAVSANQNFAEYDEDGIHLTPTGFEHVSGFASKNFIYMAIRRGGMQTPTAATDVFSVNEATNPRGFVTTGFPVDLHMQRKTESGDGFNLADRLRGERKFLYTTETSSEYTFNTSNPAEFDHMNGINNLSYASQAGKDTIFYNWKRARGYFDVVAYTGNSTSKQDIDHNLGVEPEMIWIKNRDQSGYSWIVGTGAIGWDYYLSLNNNSGRAFSSAYFGNTAPTSSVFSVGQTAGQDDTNRTTYKYIAYLFATVAGVSKVGSFTQSGATNVDCGFTGDTPSLIILKRRDAAGNWYVVDSERGIVAGNDPHLSFHTTDAEVTNADIVDPYSGGFATTSSITNGDYIFYAIAATS